MEIQSIQNSQKQLLKCKTNGGLVLPNSTTYYKATLTKTVWYWHQDRWIDKWNKVGSSDINPHIHDF